MGILSIGKAERQDDPGAAPGFSVSTTSRGGLFFL
jgi:hypothetical protein